MTEEPVMLQSIGLQRVRQDLVTENSNKNNKTANKVWSKIQIQIHLTLKFFKL